MPAKSVHYAVLHRGTVHPVEDKPTARALLAAGPAVEKKAKYPMPVDGQGVFVFTKCADDKTVAVSTVDKVPDQCKPGIAAVFDTQRELQLTLDGVPLPNGIRAELVAEAVEKRGIPKEDTAGRKKVEEEIQAKSFVSLNDDPGAYFWLSIDAINQRLQAGIGEVRRSARVYMHQFHPTLEECCDELDKEKKKEMEKTYHDLRVRLERFVGFTEPQGSSGVVGGRVLRVLRDPVGLSEPALKVRDTALLTMDDVESMAWMPKPNLPIMGQKLYDCVAGPQFMLDTPDFPEFSKAIKYSLDTPGCWGYKKLREKVGEFGGDSGGEKEISKEELQATYLRICLGENNGESPGIPYVMEIWPSGHYSPIHNHGGANAVIRVLSGTINVTLYPYLSEKAAVEPLGDTDFLPGDVTWISAELNQIHRLHCIDPTAPCITIQCYMYDNEDTTHYDYFDYVTPDGKSREQYTPDVDMHFAKFKKTMQAEWTAFKNDPSKWDKSIPTSTS